MRCGKRRLLNDSAKDQRERPAGDGKTGRPGPAVGGEVSGPLSLWLFCLCLAAVQEAPGGARRREDDERSAGDWVGGVRADTTRVDERVRGGTEIYWVGNGRDNQSAAAATTGAKPGESDESAWRWLKMHPFVPQVYRE